MSYYCEAPNCDGETGVMQTTGTYRRRKCRTCGYLFITEEGSYEGPNPFTAVSNHRNAVRRSGGQA